MTVTDPTIVPSPAAGRPEQTHACVRCGRPVALSVAMCDRCNPLGLADPASSQAHGTVFAAVIGGVVFLALVARLAVSGIGPFQAAVSGLAQTPAGLEVTLSVTNEGSRSGSSTCRVSDTTALSSAAALFYTPEIGPGQTLTFTRSTPDLTQGIGSVFVVECSTP